MQNQTLTAEHAYLSGVFSTGQMASHIKTIKYCHSLHVYAQTMKKNAVLKSQPVKEMKGNAVC